MITISSALTSLKPGAEWTLDGNEYSGLLWLDKNQSKPTEEEVDNEIVRLTAQQPFEACKKEAKQRIAASDWAVLSDVNLTNKSDFEAYRAQLRALILTPVSNPVWPSEPQPIWA